MILLRHARCTFNHASIIHHSTRRYTSTKISDPLRILFCGSDPFSITSLDALYLEKQKYPDSIKSIDVVCRPPKHVGRGLKKLQEPPIAGKARAFSLPLHQIDAFKGWSAPLADGEPINLIVAVSFGLFVPPRILDAAKYGGLNVHPSLLPDFRGAAPLHHTLLAGCTRTGVTLQTLDTQRFDHGLILDQTPQPGFDIPNPDSISASELTDFVAPIAAEMLVRGIRNRVYAHSPPEIYNASNISRSGGIRTAKKIVTEDRRVNWPVWTSDYILRRQRVLGPLWNEAILNHDKCLEPRKRILWGSGFRRPLAGPEQLPPGFAAVATGAGNDTSIYIGTKDGHVLQVDEISVDGQKVSSARMAAVKNDFLDLNKLEELGSSNAYTRLQGEFF
ncbi:MAG: Methionyl-tRNA formyltransferase [Icmadophila ericetorum]|nr:Methionyl-tRNA formyltransferase [Icmadophila ericetorum]